MQPAPRRGYIVGSLITVPVQYEGVPLDLRPFSMNALSHKPAGLLCSQHGDPPDQRVGHALYSATESTAEACFPHHTPETREPCVQRAGQLRGLTWRRGQPTRWARWAPSRRRSHPGRGRAAARRPPAASACGAPGPSAPTPQTEAERRPAAGQSSRGARLAWRGTAGGSPANAEGERGLKGG